MVTSINDHSLGSLGEVGDQKVGTRMWIGTKSQLPDLLINRMFHFGLRGKLSSLAVVILLSTICLTASCTRREVPTLEGRRGPDPPSQRIEDFTLVERRGGAKKWELKAVSAEAYDDRGEILAQEIVVDYYEGGTISSRMWADRGRIDQRNHNLEASSNVVIVSLEDGTRLETETLWWDSSEETLSTERPVVMTTKENDRIEGTGLKALPNLKMITVEKVHGIIKNVARVEEELNVND